MIGVAKLWFDVGIKRYTTKWLNKIRRISCGLMQETKDIQQVEQQGDCDSSCGLMQETKDIQRTKK